MSILTCVLHPGTGHIRAAAAWRDELGHCQVVAVERIEAGGCVRHGCIASPAGAANRIKQLMQKLHNRLYSAAQAEASPELRQVLQRAKFDRVYVGLGGMSMRSMLHEPSMQLPEGTTVTGEVQERLREESLRMSLCGYDVLDAVPAGYSLDGVPTPNPAGRTATVLTAHHRVIVAEERLRRGMTEAVTMAGFKVAGYIVEPLALSDILTSDERQRGCALLNIGAGTTTLAVYTGGHLRHLAVIPLGGDSVTQDIMTKGSDSYYAELMKTQWGNASGEADASAAQDSPALSTMRRIPLGELNSVMTCRYEEILANVTHQLELIGCEPHRLPGGCFLTGGGAQQKGLPTLVSRRVGFTYVATRCFAAFSYDESEHKPYYAGLFAMLAHATDDCRQVEARPQPVVPAPTPAAAGAQTAAAPAAGAEPDTLVLVAPSAPDPQEVRLQRRPSKRRRHIGNFLGDLFSSQNDGD